MLYIVHAHFAYSGLRPDGQSQRMPLADYPARLYTGQLADAMEFTGILYLYQYGIIPSARSDNLRFQGLNLSYIPGCDGQICMMNMESSLCITFPLTLRRYNKNLR